MSGLLSGARVSFALRLAFVLMLLGVVGEYARASNPNAPADTAFSSGNWSDSTKWSYGWPPQTGDKAIIKSGVTTTVDVSTNQLNYLQVDGTLRGNGTTLDTLSMNKTQGSDVVNNGTIFANNSLTIALGAANTWTGTGSWLLYVIDMGGGNNSLDISLLSDTLHLSGLSPILNQATIKPGTSSYIDFNATSGKQTIPSSSTTNNNGLNYANLIISSRSDSVILSGTGYINIANSFVPGATLGYRTAGSTVVFNGAIAQSIPAFNYYNLTSSSTGGRTLPSSGTVYIANTFTPGSNVYTSTGSRIEFNGSGAQNIPAFSYYNKLIISGSRGGNTISFPAGSVIIADSLGIYTSSATYSMSTGTVNFTSANTQYIPGSFTFYNLTIGGTRNANNVYFSSGTTTINNTFSISATFTTGTDTALAGNTILYSGAAGQIIRPMSYYNLSSSNSARTLSTTGTIKIANIFTTGTGAYTVTSSTVEFNGGTVTFPVPTAAATYNYNNLTLTGSSTTKTAGALMNISGNLTINSGVTFVPGNVTTTIGGNFTNNGTFTAGTGTITLSGTNKTIGGSAASTFNNLTISATTTTDTLSANATVSGTFSMSSATATLLSYGGTSSADTLTISSASGWAGGGIINGFIRRSHTYLTGTAYAFGSSTHTITLIKNGSPGGTSLTGVSITSGNFPGTTISDFSIGSSINHEYRYKVHSGTFDSAKVQFGYTDPGELNGITEDSLRFYQNAGTWALNGGTTSDINKVGNYGTRTMAIANLTGRWTLGIAVSIFDWICTGGSNAWTAKGNWTSTSCTNCAPGPNDVVRFGIQTFTVSPKLDSGLVFRGIIFGGNIPVAIQLGGIDSIKGTVVVLNGGTANHSISINGTASLVVTGTLSTNGGGGVLNFSSAGGTLTLGSDAAISGNSAFTLANGGMSVTGNLTQAGNSTISMTTGSMTLRGNYDYTAGTLTAGNGTVIYAGANLQNVAGVTYNNLTINKSGSTATLAGSATVGGVFNDSVGTFNCGSNTLTLNGTWRNAGTFTPSTGTVTIGGSTIGALPSVSPLNNLTIGLSTSSTTLNLNNALYLTGKFNATTGIFNLGSNTFALTDSFIIGTNGTVKVGANNFPSDSTYSFSGTVDFAGTASQNIPARNYYNLKVSNTTYMNPDSSASIGVAGTFTPGTATYRQNVFTIDYNGAGSQSIAAFNSYNNLTMSNDRGSSGTITFPASSSVGVYSALSPFAIATYTFGTNDTVNFKGGANQQIPRLGYYTLQLSSAGTKVLEDTITVQGDLAITGNASLDLSSYSIVRSTYGGTFSLGRSDTLFVPWSSGASSSNISGSNFPANFQTFNDTGTVNYNGSDFQTIANASGSSNILYHNLYLSGTGQKVFASNMTWIDSVLTLASGTTTDALTNLSTVYYNRDSVQTIAAIGYYNLTVSGTQTKTFASGTASIYNNFTASGSQVVVNAVPASVSYNGPGAQAVYAASYGTLSFTTGGTKSFGTGTTNISGDFTITAPAAGAADSGRTINFNGVGAQAVAAMQYDTLKFTGGGIKTFASGTSSIRGNFTITSPAAGNAVTNLSTIDYNGLSQGVAALDYYHISLNGSGTKSFAAGTTNIAGNFTVGGSARAYLRGASTTINYNGTGAQTVATAAYDSLTLGGSGLKTFQAGTDSIRGKFTIGGAATADAVANSSTIVFDGTAAQTIPAMSYYNLTAATTGTTKTFASGTTNIAGALTPPGGTDVLDAVTNTPTIVYNGSGTQTVRALNYYNLTSTGSAGRTLETGAVGIAGTFTPGTNVYTSSGNAINYNGAAQTVATFSYYDTLRISGSGVKTLAGDDSVKSGVNVTAGTLALGTNMIYQKVSGATLAVGAGATLQIGGPQTLPVFTNYSLANTGTVHYNGTTQTISAAPSTYGHLMLSGGTKTITGTVNVAGNFTPDATLINTGTIKIGP